MAELPKLRSIKGQIKKKLYFVYNRNTDEILATFNRRWLAIEWLLRRKNRDDLAIFFTGINAPYKRRELIFSRSRKVEGL